MSLKSLILAAFLHTAAGSAAAADTDAVGTAGDLLQVVLPLVAAGAAYTEGDPRGRGQLYGSLGATLAITHMLKVGIDEKRPTTDAENSFPSGHTAAAFSGAALLSGRYGWKVGVPAYALAAFVGYSRVEVDAHHVHDVIAGAALAMGANYVMTSARPRARVLPVVGERGTGIQLVISF